MQEGDEGKGLKLALVRKKLITEYIVGYIMEKEEEYHNKIIWKWVNFIKSTNGKSECTKLTHIKEQKFITKSRGIQKIREKKLY